MPELNFHPFPETETHRLLLRRMKLEDAPEIFILRSDERVLQFIGREPAVTIADAENFINRINEDIDANEVIMWGIALKEKPGKLIGSVCLWQIQREHYRAETGYVLHPDYWQKGIMKEVLPAVCDFGFKKLGLHSIEARINISNIASEALLRSAGFKKEAWFKEDFFFRGKFYDTVVYTLLNDSIP
jgi:[ribosomal protein S5]-alanine N-acetyltransferase